MTNRPCPVCESTAVDSLSAGARARTAPTTSKSQMPVMGGLGRSTAAVSVGSDSWSFRKMSYPTMRLWGTRNMRRDERTVRSSNSD